MEIIVDKAKLGKDIVVKNGDKHIAIDICSGMEGCLMFATIENEKVNIKHSVHNQEFCEFIAEVIETLTDYHEAWFKLKDWVKNNNEVLLYSIDDKPAKLGNKKYNYFERKQILEKMEELEPKGDE